MKKVRPPHILWTPICIFSEYFTFNFLKDFLLFLPDLKHEEWLLNSALFHQLQTISDALEKLSFSGPVKSTYPQTFIELNQVTSNVFPF